MATSKPIGLFDFAISTLDLFAQHLGAPKEVTNATSFTASNTVSGIITNGVTEAVDTFFVLSKNDSIPTLDRFIKRQATSSTPVAGWSQIGLGLSGGWRPSSELSNIVTDSNNSGLFSSTSDKKSDRATRVSERMGRGTWGDIYGAGAPQCLVLVFL
jgi:hypothetical protein